MPVTNRFDLAVFDFWSRPALHPAAWHDFVQDLAGNDLVKGGVLLSVLWALWIQPDPERQQRRELIAVTVLASLIGVALSRAFTIVAPFRQRPCSTPGLSMIMPFAGLYEIKGGSFPSDHMTLAFSLVTGIFLMRRRLGIVLGLYALIFVGVPRMYLGVHWATDILGGALLGVAITLVLSREPVRSPLTRPLWPLMARRPGAFYAAMFLASFGLMTRFESFRSLGHWFVRGLASAVQ